MAASQLVRLICSALVFVLIAAVSPATSSICHHVIDSDSGWIATPNFPNKYPKNTVCTWLLNTKQPIFFSFTHLELELSWGQSDSLYVYDGPTNSSAYLLIASMNYPKSFVSTAKQILISFTSKTTNPHTGFNITYSPCQSIKSSDSGWIATPNHPENYPKGSNRCWIFSGTNPIQFSFPKFQLEENVDYLHIYKGPTTDSSQYVRDSTPPRTSVVASTNQVLVTFFSSGRSFSGFNITYSPFSCSNILSTDSGSFTTPKYPATFPKYANCSWLIKAKQPVFLSFTDLATEYNKPLKIYDGPTESFPLLSNSLSPTSPSIVSTSNEVLITMKSQDEYPFAPFSAVYSPFKCQQTSTESGWIASPNHPSGYPDNTNICWLINVKDPIVLSFLKFDLQFSRDRVVIYDGPTVSSPVLVETGNHYKYDIHSIVSTSGQVLVTFTSDNTDSKGNTGFNITYMPYKCQNIQVKDSGSFSLSTHPMKSSDKTIWLCWLLNATEPMRITFTQYQLEKYDGENLIFYDGPTKSSKQLMKTSDARISAPYSIKSTANQVLVIYTSPQLKNKDFTATLSGASCQNVLSPGAGWFSTPNYPQKYPDNADVCWLIKATHPIMFSFKHLELERRSDFVTIYNGPDEASPVLFEASSKENLPSAIISTAHQVLITFKSDRSGSFAGFNASYSPYFAGITNKPIDCKGTIQVDSKGFNLNSLNYPFNYTNTACQWHFISDRGTTLQISFSDFSTQPQDKVEVYGWREANSGAKLMEASGPSATLPLSCNFHSTVNEMSVYFNPTSDLSTMPRMTGRVGFSATITPSVNVCGGDLNSADGILLDFINTSPQFISRCVWHIRIDAGSQVNLTMADLVESSLAKGVLFAFEVYEGRSITDNELLVRVSDVSSLSKPFFAISKSNQISVVLKDVTKYDYKDKCRPRNYPKLKLSYKPTTSQNLGCYGRMDSKTEVLSPLSTDNGKDLAPDSIKCQWQTKKGPVTWEPEKKPTTPKPSYDSDEDDY